MSHRLKAEELHQARSSTGITCGEPGVVHIREAKLGSPSAGPAARHNEAITARLRQAARLLEQQKANPFRVRAFRGTLRPPASRLPGACRPA